MVFNGSSVHEYEGQHSADGILEFIQVLHQTDVTIIIGNKKKKKYSNI